MTSKLIPYKGRDINWNKRVEVYRNLNKKGTWYSIKQDGYVVGHTDFFDMKLCHFVVLKGGQKRALKTGRRNVHAYVIGTPVGITTDRWLRPFGPRLKGRYSLQDGEFLAEDHGSWIPVRSAMHVRLSQAGLEIWMPR